MDRLVHRTLLMCGRTSHITHHMQLPEFQTAFLKERRKYHERQAKMEKLQQLQQQGQGRR